MTVVLNDPATLADLVRFGPVPHDVEAAARQQLPFENKFRALTACTENRVCGGRVRSGSRAPSGPKSWTQRRASRYGSTSERAKPPWSRQSEPNDSGSPAFTREPLAAEAAIGIPKRSASPHVAAHMVGLPMR